MDLEQLRFVRLYRKIHGVELSWMREPWRALIDGIPNGIRGTGILMRRQGNQDFERLRPRMVRLTILMFACIFFGVAFPIAFSYI